MLFEGIASPARRKLRDPAYLGSYRGLSTSAQYFMQQRASRRVSVGPWHQGACDDGVEPTTPPRPGFTRPPEHVPKRQPQPNRRRQVVLRGRPTHTYRGGCCGNVHSLGRSAASAAAVTGGDRLHCRRRRVYRDRTDGGEETASSRSPYSFLSTAAQASSKTDCISFVRGLDRT